MDSCACCGLPLTIVQMEFEHGIVCTNCGTVVAEGCLTTESFTDNTQQSAKTNQESSEWWRLELSGSVEKSARKQQPPPLPLPKQQQQLTSLAINDKSYRQCRQRKLDRFIREDYKPSLQLAGLTDSQLQLEAVDYLQQSFDWFDPFKLAALVELGAACALLVSRSHRLPIAIMNYAVAMECNPYAVGRVYSQLCVRLNHWPPTPGPLDFVGRLLDLFQLPGDLRRRIERFSRNLDELVEKFGQEFDALQTNNTVDDDGSGSTFLFAGQYAGQQSLVGGNPCIIATSMASLALRAMFSASGTSKLDDGSSSTQSSNTLTVASDGRRLPIFARRASTTYCAYRLSPVLMRLLCSAYHVSERQIERHMSVWCQWLLKQQYPFIGGPLTIGILLPQLELILDSQQDIFTLFTLNRSDK